jgi:GtrA-like protein
MVHLLPARVQRLMPELSLYTIVSIVALGIDLVVFNGLLLGHARASMAGVVGYLSGLVVHYVLSCRYVFVAAAGKSDVRRFVEFAVSGGVGLAITWAVIHGMTEIAQLPALVAKVVAVATSFVVVFMLRRSVVFAGRNTAVADASDSATMRAA